MTENQLETIFRESMGMTGETPLTLTRTRTGKFNQTWFVTGEDLGREWVLRVAHPDDRSRVLFYEHRMMRQEPEIHALVAEKTSTPVPEIRVFCQDHPKIGRDFIIMERLPGDPLNWSQDQTVQELGKCLREVHDNIRARPGAYGYLGAHRPMEPQPTWREAFVTMWHLLLDDVRDSGGYTGDKADEYRRLLDEHLGCFDHYHEPASLLHMDVWAENILADPAGHLTGLIDWDRACWGDPEIEFAVMDYCSMTTPAFWEGYGKPDPRSGPGCHVRRVFYLLYEIQKYIVIRIARQSNPRGATEYVEMAERLAERLKRYDKVCDDETFCAF